MLIQILFAGAAFAQTSACLIQQNSVGPLRVGMTVAQVRQTLHGATLKSSQDADALPLLAVIREGLHTMDLYVNADTGMKETSKIELIRVFDGACSTSDGIHPGMPLSDVAKRYGRLKRLFVTDSESREYAEFDKQPPWLDVQTGNGQAGRYPVGKRCTSDYNPSAHIASLWISHMPNKLPEEQFNCTVPLPRR